MRNWSISAIKDEDFVVGDVCRLDDETIIQVHLKGSHHFSVVTEYGNNVSFLSVGFTGLNEE